MNWLERGRARKELRRERKAREASERLDFDNFLDNILHRHPGRIEDLEEFLVQYEGFDRETRRLVEMNTGTPKHYVIFDHQNDLKKLREEGLVGLVEFRMYADRVGGGGTKSGYLGGVPVRIENLQDPTKE